MATLCLLQQLGNDMAMFCVDGPSCTSCYDSCASTHRSSPYFGCGLPLNTFLSTRTAQQIPRLDGQIGPNQEDLQLTVGIQRMIHTLGSWLAACMRAQSKHGAAHIVVGTLTVTKRPHTGSYLGLYIPDPRRRH